MQVFFLLILLYYTLTQDISHIYSGEADPHSCCVDPSDPPNPTDCLP